MTDNQLIQSLIDRDERITQQFFFQNCRPLFKKVISLVFSYPVDYDEFVNEFYLYLMEKRPAASNSSRAGAPSTSG